MESIAADAFQLPHDDSLYPSVKLPIFVSRRQHGATVDSGFGPSLTIRPDPTMDLSLADLVRAPRQKEMRRGSCAACHRTWTCVASAVKRGDSCRVIKHMTPFRPGGESSDAV